jgi:hypothetical protein
MAPEFSDTTVSPSTAYTYAVAVFDAAGNTAVSAPITVTTAPAAGEGDAPYCNSPVIGSMTWHWTEGYTQANGSDLWPATWGADGNTYAFFGDGGGFGGDDHVGRASFGIAMIKGAPPLSPAGLINLYGGYHARYPATLTGKAASIVAVGRDFYAIAGIFRPTDTMARYPHRPSGSPDHVEIAYSKHNAYSWRDGSWTFCSLDFDRRDDSDEEVQLSGSFCPAHFVGYGRGNSGAPGGYVYILGAKNSVGYWRGGIGSPPAYTYLARVPQRKVLRASAYQYFAGLDDDGNPIWSSDTGRMQPIFSDRNPPRTGCGGLCNMTESLTAAVYVPALKRYIGIAEGDYEAQTSFFEAPELWGPWSLVSYNNIDPAQGTGGFGNLGTAGGEALGVCPVSAWTSADGRTLWMTYSSTGKAPPDALFPPAGAALDSFNLVSVELNLAP